ncbi:MAG: hypothetical protein ACK2T7_12170 [Anaerolineales bacterium]
MALLPALMLPACSLSSRQLDAESLEQTAMVHLTSVAYLNKTAEAIVQKTESVLPTLPPTQTYAPTVTPKPRTLTPTTPGPSPTNTETPTTTATPTATPLAQALVTGDTNCRSGPSKSYPWIALIPAGTTVDIIATDITGDYYVIENPFADDEDDEEVCWLWGEYLSLVRTTADLPHFSAPPTLRPTSTPRDTPEPSFRIYEQGLIECNGQYALVIMVRNYTLAGFRSWRAQLFNTSPKQLQTRIASNQFSHSAKECQMTIGTLDYGRTGYAIIPIDPYQDDTYLIEFEACTLNNKKGDCAFGGIYVDKVDILPTPTPSPTP